MSRLAVICVTGVFASAIGCIRAHPRPDLRPRRDGTLVIAASVSLGEGKTAMLSIPIPRDEPVQVTTRLKTAPATATRVVDRNGNVSLRFAVTGDATVRVECDVTRGEERPGARLPQGPAEPEWTGVTPATAEADARRAFEASLRAPDDVALFVSLLYASGVPARLREGVLLPPAGTPGAPVEHAWVEYRSRAGWRAADVALAALRPDRREALFGTLDPDRVGFSLDAHATPHAEVDGTPIPVRVVLGWTDRR